jgi:hypothetical protein
MNCVSMGGGPKWASFGWGRVGSLRAVCVSTGTAIRIARRISNG